jgi:hypothetical protein
VKKRIVLTGLALSTALAITVPATSASAAGNCVPADMVGSAGYAEGPNGQRLYACPTTDAARPATVQPQRPAPRRATSTPRRSTRTVCGTWWVKGRAANGSGGTRRGYAGTWHIVRECRRIPVR